MTVTRTHRYAVAPADLDEFLARRGELIAAMRARHTGLSHTRLIQLDHNAFIDMWSWDSAEEMQAAFASVPTMPEVAAAMSLTTDNTADDGPVIDER